MRGLAIGRSIADAVAEDVQRIKKAALVLPEDLPSCTFGEILGMSIVRDQVEVTTFGSIREYVVSQHATVRLQVTDFVWADVVGLDAVFGGIHYSGTLQVQSAEMRFRPGLPATWDITAVSTDLTAEWA